MKVDARIVILERGTCDLDYLRDEDGSLSICIPSNVAFNLQRKNEELTEVEKLTSDYSNTFNINVDANTRFMLQNVERRIIKGFSIYRAILLVNDMVLIDGFLYVSKTTEQLNNGYVKYSIQMVGTHQRWKDYFRDNCLSALDLGVYTWNNTTVFDLIDNNQFYSDGGDSIYPLLADFGRFYGTGGTQVNLHDFRFVVYAKAILEQAFCQAGYKLQSTFMSTSFFRQEALYLLPPNFANPEQSAGLQSKEVFVGVLTADQQLDGSGVPFFNTIRFDDIQLDSYGNWNAVAPYDYFYVNNGTTPIDNIVLKVDFVVCNESTSPEDTGLLIQLEDSTGSIIGSDFVVSTQTSLAGGACYIIELEYDISQLIKDEGINADGTLEAGYRIRVIQNSLFGFSVVKAGSSMRYCFTGKHFYEGDTVDVANRLGCNFTVWNLFVELKRIYNLRVRTIESKKIVIIEPSPARYTNYRTFDTAEQTLRGFEGDKNDLSQVWDITDKVDVCSVIEKDFKPTDTANSIRFKFKDSTDKYSGYFPYQVKDNPLWSNYIITDSQGEKEVTVELDIIEPTLNDYVSRIATAPELGGVFIPAMWDSEPNEDEVPPNSVNIEPRLLHVFGKVTQVARESDGTPNAQGYVYETGSIQELPLVAQVLPPDLEFIADGAVSIVSGFEINNVYLDNVYQTSKNLVNTFYPDSIRDLQEAVDIRLKVNISVLDFYCNAINSVVRIFSENVPLMAINDYYRIKSIMVEFGNSELATIVLVPQLVCSDE